MIDFKYDGRMRTIEEKHEEIYQIVKKVLECE